MSLALALAARTPSPCTMMFSFETRSRADLPFRLVALRGRYEMSHFTHVGTDGRHGTVAVREAGGTPDETKPPPFTELGWRAFGHHLQLCVGYQPSRARSHRLDAATLSRQVVAMLT